MRRRRFVAGLGAAALWPFPIRAEQSALPIVGFVRDGSAQGNAPFAAAFRKGLGERGYVEGQNVAVEYYWLEGNYDRLPALMAELVARKVAVIATPGGLPTLAAKRVTATIPVVFGVGEHPVRLGLVNSLANPGGNFTGVNFFVTEVLAKRLRLLNEIVPQAIRIGLLVNLENGVTGASTVHEVESAAPMMGLQVQQLKAATPGEIDAAFSIVARERLQALFVAPDALFVDRRHQLAQLALRDHVPTTCSIRDQVEAGCLMSYGVDLADVHRQIGIYCGNILRGAKPAGLPVLQSTKFEFVINLQTAKALGLSIPGGIPSIADEVIE